MRDGDGVAVHDRQQLNAIAGGDDHALGDTLRGSQGARGLGKLVGADGNLLAQRDGRRFMIHADEHDRH